ncbi:MAG TPA: peroxiredoxin [Candidatus Binataceae bacterium]|nr:peroxiredoxin [Candidatus Binataceae bacterium]
MPRPERPQIGDQFPADWVLPNQFGEEVRLGSFAGRNLVLYFYPADDTPGCTVEGKEFRELYEEFRALDCEVVGVSVDSVQSHRRFAERHDLRFPLLSDREGKLARWLGVMGEQVAERATFVIDRELRVRRCFEAVHPRGHAQQVLDFVRSLLESHRMLGG